MVGKRHTTNKACNAESRFNGKQKDKIEYKAVANGWIKYSYTGVIIQHLWQTAVLFTAIKWAFHRCVESVIHSSALWSLELPPSTNGSRR